MKRLLRLRVLASLLVGLAAGAVAYVLPLERPRAILPPWHDVRARLFSPDSRLFLTTHEHPFADDPLGQQEVPVGPDGAVYSVRLWDAASGQLLRKFHQDDLWCPGAIAFSSDSTRVGCAGGSRDGGRTVKIWETETGDVIAEYKNQLKEPFAGDIITFSPDGRLLVWDDLNQSVWDAETRRVTVDYSEKGNRWKGERHATQSGLVVVNDESLARVLRMSTGEILAEHRMPRRDTFHRPVLTPDGRRMIAMLYTPEAGEPRIAIDYWGIAGPVYLWDADQGFCRRVRLAEPPDSGFGEISPDGRRMVIHPSHDPNPFLAWLLSRSKGQTRASAVLDLESEREVATFNDCYIDGFSPDGKSLAVIRINTVELWDFPLRKPWGIIVSVGLINAGIMYVLPAYRFRRRNKPEAKP
jgi:WD40 repeat protein